MATDATKTHYDPDRDDPKTKEVVERTDVVRTDVPDRDRDTNPDPITGAPGSHPIETGVGATGGAGAGAALGAAIGSATAGPVGTVVGAMIGGVAGAVGGGYAGKAVGEYVDPTEEHAYWEKTYTTRPYYQTGYTYTEDYAPAYQYGWESRGRYQGRTWDEAEPDVRSGWEGFKGKSRLEWERAKLATRDAWERASDKIERAVPGDSDKDGK